MKKKWVYSLLLCAVALVIINTFYKDDIAPLPKKMDSLTKPTQRKPPKKNEWTKTVKQPSNDNPKVRDTSLEIANQENKVEEIIDEPYEIEVVYPRQHFFDGTICQLDKARESYKPERERAIQRLGDKYKHHIFVISEYVVLNLYSTNASEYFQKTLTERIRALHAEYLNMLGEAAQQMVTINLIILPQRVDYLQHILRYSTDLENTIGVYFGGLNLAFVDYQASDDKALKTAMHETTHVLNSHILGRTPHMFNEGMAELYENLHLEEGNIKLAQSEHKLMLQTYPLELFFDNEQWQYLNTGHLYYSSWAWTMFMHIHQAGLRALIYFMQEELVNPCSSLSADESYLLFQEAFNGFEIDFNDWQKNLTPYQE
ncbi:hypothetical protein N8878_05515 [Psychromonas sp.]|nr:hypothetical protein [Psychromonas sp.]